MVIAVKKFGKQRVNVRHILVIQLKLRGIRLTPLKAGRAAKTMYIRP